jgi:hypothetical protein
LRPVHDSSDWETEEDNIPIHFGDKITKKSNNTLRIGFQNIGGIPTQKNKHKDDIIRLGIGKLEFDIWYSRNKRKLVTHSRRTQVSQQSLTLVGFKPLHVHT